MYDMDGLEDLFDVGAFHKPLSMSRKLKGIIPSALLIALVPATNWWLKESERVVTWVGRLGRL